MAKDWFGLRSFGTVDSRRIEVFEKLCFEFLSANIWRGDTWNDVVFHSTKAVFGDGMKEVAEWGRLANVEQRES